MVDVGGTSLSAEESEMLMHPMVGGVILFSRNYESVEQARALIQSIHALRSPRLLVAVDQEGGRVQRFRDELLRLPPVSRLGELYDKNKAHARHCAQTTGWLMASELLALGVDLSFAPVLDLDYGVSTVIGDRAFHRHPEVVADLAHSYTIGMRQAGMSATGKHFPGHGAVTADSHTHLPVDHRPYVDFVNEDMLPFERMINFDIAALMMAHVIYDQVDSVPASFSRHWIKNVLRAQLGFQGAIFSDDLTMVAAHSMGSYSERAQRALQAGCDMVLVCNSPEGRNEVLDNCASLDNPASHARLVRMHGKHKLSWEQLRQMPEWSQAVALVKEYDLDPLLNMDIE